MVKLALGRSRVEGIGVFAIHSISSGSTVIKVSGKEDWVWNIPKKELKYCYQIDFDRYLLPDTDVARFVNHSCSPNCLFKGKNRLIAFRRIERGEEITFDYSTNVGWDGFEMECTCGSKDCRGKITSYRYLHEKIKKKYGDNISSFLLVFLHSKIKD
jgi:SET domain-containing protein